VCVAGLCIKQKDLLHAGYLAITLLFFRQRTLLMTAPAAQHDGAVKGVRLFMWLPAFNLMVMTLTLIYQVCGKLPEAPTCTTSQLGTTHASH
jgi:hypothetical protein